MSGRIVTPMPLAAISASAPMLLQLMWRGNCSLRLASILSSVERSTDPGDWASSVSCVSSSIVSDARPSSSAGLHIHAIGISPSGRLTRSSCAGFAGQITRSSLRAASPSVSCVVRSISVSTASSGHVSRIAVMSPGSHDIATRSVAPSRTRNGSGACPDAFSTS